MVLLADDYKKRRRLNITRGDYHRLHRDEEFENDEFEDENDWDD